jgi:hypothetical protein
MLRIATAGVAVRASGELPAACEDVALGSPTGAVSVQPASSSARINIPLMKRFMDLLYRERKRSETGNEITHLVKVEGSTAADGSWLTCLQCDLCKVLASDCEKNSLAKVAPDGCLLV